MDRLNVKGTTKSGEVVFGKFMILKISAGTKTYFVNNGMETVECVDCVDA